MYIERHFGTHRIQKSGAAVNDDDRKMKKIREMKSGVSLPSARNVAQKLCLGLLCLKNKMPRYDL